MLKTTRVTIRGLPPLLMHNGNLSDPLHESSIALARLSGKRKKTADDHRELSRCEWYGGLYVDAKGRPCLPGEVLEAAIAEGAKRTKRGKDAKGGVMVVGDWPIEYEGPKTADGLWSHGGFIKRARVRVKQAAVIRTRPIFPEWRISFDVQWDSSVIRSEADLIELVTDAGLSGVGDWRPKFGRFEVVS
jgi:hypothetical protein